MCMRTQFMLMLKHVQIFPTPISKPLLPRTGNYLACKLQQCKHCMPRLLTLSSDLLV